jgi:NADH-quinone oxidoreductase subunit N
LTTLILLFLGGVATLFAGIFLHRKNIQPLVLLILTAALGSSIWGIFAPVQPSSYDTMWIFDAYAMKFTAIAIFSTLLLVLLSARSLKHTHDTLADHYALMLFVLCGAICMASFQNMVMLFLGIEILSIPLYVLAGSRKNDLHSNEAALKYFIMGAFATGFLLMGIALVYGATGHFDTQGIAAYLTAQNTTPNYLLHIGILMLVVAMCFKVGAVPFHFWSPDVYQGAPTLVTAFMATVVKVAAFAAFFRLFMSCFVLVNDVYATAIAVVAAVTILLANLVAARQSSVKRMLAYSSISHAGYLLMVLLPDAMFADFFHNTTASDTVLFVYLAAYTVATVGVFALYLGVVGSSDFATTDAFNGFARRKPIMAATGTIAMLSLAGIPPTAGFFGKYLVFTQTLGNYPWLVIVAIVGSGISIFYYLRLVVAMYFNEPTADAPEINPPEVYQVVMIVCVILLFLIPFLPNIMA